MSRNRLDQETSPYLRQHKENPVHWQPWGADALATAKERNVPILLSIGYAACHWCHVMAHESFEDKDVAAVMNAGFVNVKIDREERPDLDLIYQAALSLMGEQGGWPLTMFLTPDGAPFYGGTYFPPEANYGRPAWRDLLASVTRIYQEDPDKVTRNAVALRNAVAETIATSAEGELPPEFLEQTARGILRLVDRKYGGIGKAPKFPQTPIFELLWRAHRRGQGEAFGGAVTRTLDHICAGGIYDHLGGGFARYATDQEWHVPHFEKMLYDNAQLIEQLTLVWQETRNPFYEERVHETVAWVLREMQNAAGGFLSSLDADSEGREGAFYVWTEAEIDALLGDTATAFKATYDVRAGGNWEGRTILRRNAGGALPVWNADQESRLRASRETLFAARAQRPRPGTDDKVLADWSGLMIAAMAFAGRVFEQPDWVNAARRGFDFVCEKMTTGDGRLHHSWCRDRSCHPATLDDYAQMARAALALYETDFADGDLAHATNWVAIANAKYWDAEKGGYFFTPDDMTELFARPKPGADNATPSGNGVMACVLAHLFYLTGDTAMGTRAQAVIRTFAGDAIANPPGYATLLNASEFLHGALQITVLGDPAATDTRALLKAIHAVSLPNHVTQVVADEAALPHTHPAKGKQREAGRATCYLCRGPVCSVAIADADALEAALRDGG